MRKSSGVLLAACLLAATPALAGNMTFDHNQTVWHSTECIKPDPPKSVLNAEPETKGDAMNALVVAYNAYIAAAQAYMTCISREAEHDQGVVSHAIISGAETAIAVVRDEAGSLSVPSSRKK